jgi:hypothetical protein
MSTRHTVYSREQHEYNTDPQRRCYYGCHAKSEWRWTLWRPLYTLPTLEEAQESVEGWRHLALTAKPRRLEYMYLPEDQNPNP